MAEKFFNFKDQMVIGDEGEKRFVAFYKDLQPVKSKDRKIDFTLNNGLTVELKTDNYLMENTPNFFMEKFTVSKGRKNLGGPWRAQEHEVDYFVYYFLNDGKFFWFKPVTLCRFLDEYVEKYKPELKTIPNKDEWGNYYAAEGYKIPRDCVRTFLLRED